jgi:hypothetical protein
MANSKFGPRGACIALSIGYCTLLCRIRINEKHYTSNTLYWYFHNAEQSKGWAQNMGCHCPLQQLHQTHRLERGNHTTINPPTKVNNINKTKYVGVVLSLKPMTVLRGAEGRVLSVMSRASSEKHTDNLCIT